MADTITPPIIVSANAGPLDALAGFLRQLGLVVTAIPMIWAFLGKGDLIALIQWFGEDDGKKWLAAVAGVLVWAYGTYKTHKRGAQVATVAISPKVPSSVAMTKEEASTKALYK